MSFPAARVTDMHVCPMVTGLVPHVGGPILPPGVPTILIAGMPAAAMSAQCVCVGPPDVIVRGSAGCLYAGKPAARMTDQCAHGGIIVAGCPTVLIGEQGAGSGSPGSGATGSTKGAGIQVATLLEAARAGMPFVKRDCDQGKGFARATSPADEGVPDWVAISLSDDSGLPVPHARYVVTTAGGEVREGRLDANGEAREEGIDPGECMIRFPDLDLATWAPRDTPPA